MPPEQAAGATTEAAEPHYHWPNSRSWLSVDVRFKGRWLRFIGAHLKNLGSGLPPSPSREDGAELRAIADASPLPVVLASYAERPKEPSSPR